MLGLEKWLFWENSFSLLEAIDRLAGEESVWLARTVFVLVILLPFASLAGWMIVGVASHFRQPLGRWAAIVLELDEWAMVDVFFLAAVVVFAKMGNLADVTAGPGLGYLGASAALFVFVSFGGRHFLRWTPDEPEPKAQPTTRTPC